MLAIRYARKYLKNIRNAMEFLKEDLNILGGWDAAEAAIEAIRVAKDPKSGESIREAAERIIDVPAATGRAGTRIKYAPDRHYILGADSFAWVQIKSGKLEYVD